MSGVPGSRCVACEGLLVPPRPWCSRCGGPVRAEAAPEVGRLVTWTRVEAAPAGFESGGVVGVVELGDARAAALWEGVSGGRPPPVGAAVRVRLGKDGRLRYGAVI